MSLSKHVLRPSDDLTRENCSRRDCLSYPYTLQRFPLLMETVKLTV